MSKKLNQIEECEWCGEQADFEYKISNNDGLSFFCKKCIKAAEELNKNILKERIEEEAARDERDEIYNLIEEVENEIESFLLNNNIDFEKINSKMSASVYFELDNFKIRISDHASRPAYNVINGEADFTVGVGFEDGFLNATVFKKDEIKDVLKKLLKKLAV